MCCQRSEQQGLLALRPPSPKLLVFTSTRDCDCSPDFGFSGCLNVRALSVSSSVTILSSDFPQAIWKGSPGRDSQAGGGRNVPHPPPRPPHCCLGISSRRGHPALRPPGVGHTPPSALRPPARRPQRSQSRELLLHRQSPLSSPRSFSQTSSQQQSQAV